MADSERINQIIEDAITILNDDTWCKGEERVPHFAGPVNSYRYCAIGALKEAVGFDWTNSSFRSDEDADAYREAGRRCDKVVAAEGIPCGCGCGNGGANNIVAYNDGVAKSVEDVKLMMKRAIET